jgi:hypothetical protein
MPNNKDNQKSGSQSSMSGTPNRDFESEDNGKSLGMAGQSGRSTSNRGMGSNSSMDDDEMNSAGGRQGNFSDKNRDKEQEWSPGSTSSSNQ